MNDQLTPREREVLNLTQRGLTNEVIAQRLGISRSAVRYHLKEIHSKLETGGDRSRLVEWLRCGVGLGALVKQMGVAKVAVGAAMGTFAVAGSVAASSLGSDPPPPLDTGAVQAVDGFYPNGCPDHVNTWQETTLREFVEDYRGALGSYETLFALNPALADGPIAAGTAIRVPYRANAECGEARATPADAPPAEAAGNRGTPTVLDDAERPGAIRPTPAPRQRSQ